MLSRRLNRVASRRASLIDRLRRVAHLHVDAREGDIELVGGDLRERGFDAGAEIDLAGRDEHGAVFANGDPRIELPRIQIVRIAVRIDVRRRLAERFRQRAENAEADDQRAALEELAPREAPRLRSGQACHDSSYARA